MQLLSIALLGFASAAGLRGSPKKIIANGLTPVTEYVSEREAGSTRGVLNVTLELDAFQFTDGDVSFVTRAWNGQIPGPALRVLPGDRLIVTVKNNLQNSDAGAITAGKNQKVLLSGSETPQSNGIQQTTTPYYHPNSTNLHTHGLHVSALLGSDNVMSVTIDPGEAYTYTYDIPDDHMPGTFWYHTHLHGSTMLQTGGGASGMLMVDTPPTMAAVQPTWLQAMNMPQNEEIVMINTIPFTSLTGVSEYSNPLYAPLANYSNDPISLTGNSALSHSQALFQVSDKTSAMLPENWNTQAAPTNENNQYQNEEQKAEGAGSSPPGNTSTITNIAIVNGKVAPTMKLTSGEWRQWKILHAGPFFFMDLTLEPEDSRATAPKCEMQLLAKDGIYLEVMPRVEQRLILPPAGRADVLVRCNGEGKMRLVSGARPGRSGKWSGDLYWNPVMAIIDVAASKGEYASPAVTLAPYRMERPAYLRNLVTAPAQNVNGQFAMRFDGRGVKSTTATGKPMYPHDGTNSATCLVNGLTFAADKPVGTMKVNTMQEWDMGNVAGHPLHLHVNPFQLTEIADSVYSPTAHSYCDLEFGYTCVSDWLDTLQLPTAAAGGKSDAKFRFMTDSFVGNEVMHCHYLNHEDTGCMTFFEIEE